MNRIYLFLFALIFAASSCSNDIDNVSPAGDESAFSFIVGPYTLKIEKVGATTNSLDSISDGICGYNDNKVTGSLMLTFDNSNNAEKAAALLDKYGIEHQESLAAIALSQHDRFVIAIDSITGRPVIVHNTFRTVTNMSIKKTDDYKFTIIGSRTVLF
ncbi:hypothetical protein Barb6XT_02077 [Bacteroidales bacterium Barb6XT]|nr:hypothetical protein Barb6XT_02077 [Bacteroidales bacterium Barb6XT]